MLAKGFSNTNHSQIHVSTEMLPHGLTAQPVCHCMDRYPLSGDRITFLWQFLKWNNKYQINF